MYGDLGDWYPAYNLPGGMNYWAHATEFTDRKYVVKLDADMLLLKPLTVKEIPASRGTTAAGMYGYLSGVSNGMAKWFVDEEVESRLATVGGWEIFDSEDFKKMTPYWLEYTAKVRMDSRVWYPYKGTGDVYVTEESPRPWISEMYGFIFGCGVAGLRHNVMPSTQLYAGMSPWNEESADPYIIHYGITLSDGKGYSWDKHGAAGYRERMTCETQDEEPFPVLDWPPPLQEGASVKAKYTHIGLQIMHITVRKINEAVYAYNAERCQQVLSSSPPPPMPLSLPPPIQAPTRVRKSLRDMPEKVALAERHLPLEKEFPAHPKVEALLLETMQKELARKKLVEIEREEKMHRMWSVAKCAWVLGVLALARYAYPRWRARVKSRKFAREKNPFRRS
jgi:hypothetical protein